MHTVFAFTSTETSVEGRLTRQFFNDCCSAISACTIWPVGFFSGAMMIQKKRVCGLYVKGRPAHAQRCSDCAALPRLSAPTWGAVQAVSSGRKPPLTANHCRVPWRRANDAKPRTRLDFEHRQPRSCDWFPSKSTSTCNRTPRATLPTFEKLWRFLPRKRPLITRSKKVCVQRKICLNIS